MKRCCILFFSCFITSRVLAQHIPDPDSARIKNKSDVKTLKTVEIRGDVSELKKTTESRNIELVDERFIQQHLGGSLMQTLSRLPGINNIGIGAGQSKPLIRGLGFNRVIVVDKRIKHEGQQWGADHGLEIDQFAIGELEVIKGPSSFMYGSDAIGGAINLKPSAVPDKNGLTGQINLIGKSNNALYGTSIYIAKRKDKWIIDGRITYQQYADYKVPTDTVYVYDYAVGLYQNRLRNTAGMENGLHLSIGYIDKKFNSTLYLNNSRTKSGFFANAHGLEPRKVDESIHDYSDRDLQMPYQTVNHFKIISRTQFTHNKNNTELEMGFQRNFRNEFNHYVNHGYMPANYPGDFQIPINLERQYDKNIFSTNLRHLINGLNHKLIIGLNADYQDNKIGGWSFLIPAFKQWSAGIFAYDKYAIRPELILHSALRLDRGRIDFERYNDWFISPLSNSTGIVEQYVARALDFDRGFSSMVWSGGLNYNSNNKMAFKFNLGKSFRMPIAKELAANGVNYHYFSYEKGNAALDAEIACQVDLGLFVGQGKWSVSLSPFYQYFPNYIYLNPTSSHDYEYGAGNQVFEYTQAQVLRYGGEISISYKPISILSAELSGEFLHSEQLSGSKKGFTLPFSPPTSVLANLSWSPNTGRNLSSSYLSIDYRITASQNQIVPPERKTPGYQLINIQFGTSLQWGRHTIALAMQVQNLMNTKCLNHTSFYRLIELPEAGRNFILSLRIPIQFT